MKFVHTCWTLWSVYQKNGELWARPPLLTPVFSQANHSSLLLAVGCRRVRLPRNSHTFFDSLVRVPRDTPEKIPHRLASWSVFCSSTDQRITKKTNSFSVCHCLGAWSWWSGRGDTKFEKSFSTRRGGHSAELARATTNSEGR